jgi:hypothetical protein
MSVSTGGRGTTPPFNPSKYRGAPPELMALVKEIEDILAATVEGEQVPGGHTEYVPVADDLDSFVVRHGEHAARVLGFEAMQQQLVVSYVDAKGNTEQVEIDSEELVEVVAKRNRALTQLETFLQRQITEGQVADEQRSKLKEILSNVSQYQSHMMHAIDRQLKLSEKVSGS